MWTTSSSGEDSGWEFRASCLFRGFAPLAALDELANFPREAFPVTDFRLPPQVRPDPALVTRDDEREAGADEDTFCAAAFRLLVRSPGWELDCLALIRPPPLDI